jgi:hypothetical protein
MLVTSFSDGTRFIQQAYDSLRPGGWLELQDLLMPFTSDDGTFDNTSHSHWQDLFFEAMAKLGRDPKEVGKYDQWMREVGFEGVTRLSFKWPQNLWPKDKGLKELGAWNMLNSLDGLEGFTMRPFQYLGMSPEEVQVVIAKTKQDIRNRKIHTYWPMFVLNDLLD